jgi:CBS-domain-containing membrane protein
MSQVASRATPPTAPVSVAAPPASAIHVPTRAPSYSLASGAVACAGVFIVIGVMAFASFNLGWLLLLGSFGSSAVMVFTFPEIHFSQPRSVIGGHVICTAVGLAALALFGPTWWALAGATAAAVALMMLTRTLHPPAGSNPVIVFLVAPAWGFLVFPTLSGALAMVAVAVLYHRACRRPYPAYWY